MKRLYRNLALAALLSTHLSATQAAVTEIHTGGTTYSFAEPDALEEIQAKARSADIEKIMQKDRDSWSAFRGLPLPLATQTKTRKYIPWYALEFDIKDAKGRIIYPKGFRFNPLQYTHLPYRIVIAKIDQFPHIKHLLRPTDMLIADTGDVIQAGLEFGQHIYIAEPGMKERFGVRAVPSFIKQVKYHFQIQEIAAHELSN